MLYPMPCGGLVSQQSGPHATPTLPQANSPDREDLLPGLCALAERWIGAVAWPCYAPSTA